MRILLSKMSKSILSEEQNFAFFYPCRLINNKINRLHKSSYEELLKNADDFVSVHQKELMISFYGVTQLYERSFSIFFFFWVVFVKNTNNAVLNHLCGKIS